MSNKRPRNALRSLALLLVGLLVIAGFTNSVSATDASWTSAETSNAQFTGGRINAVQNLQCIDSKNGLLGTGLGRDEVELIWDPPAGLEGNPAVTYDVTWDEGLLSPTGSDNVSTTSYEYTSGASLLSLGVDFTVSTRVDNWVSPTPVEASAAGIGVSIISVYLGCSQP